MKIKFLYIALFLSLKTYSFSRFPTQGLRSLSSVGSPVLAAISHYSKKIKKSVGTSLQGPSNGITQSSEKVEYKLLIPADSFDPSCLIAECQFSDIKPPEGMTREDWYKRMLQDQENHRRSVLLKELGLSEQDYDRYAYELYFKLIATEKKLAKELEKDKELESWLFEHDYDHEVRFSDKNYNKIIGQAFCNLVVLRPIIYKLSEIEQKMALHHEASYIRHYDFLFTTSIDSLLRNYSCLAYRVLGKKMDIDCDFSFIFKPKIICNRSVKKRIRKLFLDNLKHVEYRADMESLFLVKSEKVFQESLTDKNNYQGYPFTFKSNYSYCSQAKVDYITDFLKGIKNDYFYQLSKKEEKKKSV